jgi:hypothetical protein
MVFRGWYDFGGGSMADMGHYSLWTVFNALKLTSPTVIEPHRSHVVRFKGAVPYRINNDFSFQWQVRFGLVILQMEIVDRLIFVGMMVE